MITDLEAFGWIQKYRSDPLIPADSSLAQRLLNRRSPAANRKAYASQLEGIVSHYPVSVARGNVRIHLGIFFLEIGDCGTAVGRFKEAAEDYHKVSDFHCLGAALWLLGMAQREMDQHKLGFARWKESRDLMIDLYRESERFKRIEWAAGKDHNFPGKKWYSEQIKNMTADMLRTPHDMFEWAYAGPDAPKQTLFPMPKSGPGSSTPQQNSVYRFKRNYDGSDSSMGSSVTLMRKKIDDLLESRAHPRVPDVLRYLEAMNQGPPSREFCEIHTYCATMADFLPDRDQEAVQHLIKARCASPLQSRTRMIVTWMLGLLWLRDPNRRCDAIRSMEDSITCARRLEAAAYRENDSALQQWYQWHADAMQQVLQEHVQAIL